MVVRALSARAGARAAWPGRRVADAAHAPRRPRARRAARWASSASEVVAFGILPAAATLAILWLVRDNLAYDLHRAFRPAAEAVLAGRSPYPPPTAEALATRTEFVYLPLAAFLYVPFALVPAVVADIAATVLVLASGGAALWTLGVRDWRCYGLALWTPPVLAAAQTANLTLPLALGLAVVWVARARPLAPGLVLAVTLATKLFLWPVLVWLLATRRYRAAGGALATTAALVAGGWTLLGFAGLADYPALLRTLSSLLERDSYTAFAVATDLGAPVVVARTVGLAIAAAALAACWILGRRGADERSFTLAIVASLLFTPIVWLHYFALLLVPVAIARRRLSALWAAPLALWLVGAGYGNGTTAQTTLTLVVAGCIAGLAVRAAAPAAPRAA